MLLYVDSSSLLTSLLGQSGFETVDAVTRDSQSRGATLVSSRLLVLEVARTVARERLGGYDIQTRANEATAELDILPVTDGVWEYAAAIAQHLRAPDALHLATCELADASLLGAGLDRRLRDAALERGVTIIG